MRAHDLALAAKLCRFSKNTKANQTDLAKSLCISQSEVSDGLRRLIESKILHEDKQNIDRKSFVEYLVYGARYHFPADPGKPRMGIPTAHSTPIYSEKIASSYGVVWPWEDFKNGVLGCTIVPLYPKLPQACINDLSLYAIFAAFDLIRIGNDQEKKLAIEVIEKQLLVQKS